MANLLAKVLCSLLLVVLASFAGLIGWIRSAARFEPEHVLAVDRGQADALLTLAQRAGLSNEAPARSVAGIGAKLLQRAPLHDAPLVYAALEAVAAGDESAARRTFSLAIQRQPRSIPALEWLAADAIQQRRFELAADFLERLARLNIPDEMRYARALASIVEDRQGASVLERDLAGQRPLAQKALLHLNSTSDDVPLLLRLNAHVPSGQAAFIRRLVEQHGPREAFRAWLALAPESETRGLSWPFDPVFIGSTAPPPFNWAIYDGAELLDQGGLYARYSGRGNPVFTDQLMMLGPGNYRFHVEMDGDSAATGGGFEWMLTCDPGKHLLGGVSVQALTPTMSDHGFDFVVLTGEDCFAQRLVLRGLPGHMPDKARTTIRRVMIQSVGDRQ